jgi:hypothetical protein
MRDEPLSNLVLYLRGEPIFFCWFETTATAPVESLLAAQPMLQCKMYDLCLYSCSLVYGAERGTDTIKKLLAHGLWSMFYVQCSDRSNFWILLEIDILDVLETRRLIKCTGGNPIFISSAVNGSSQHPFSSLERRRRRKTNERRPAFRIRHSRIRLPGFFSHLVSATSSILIRRGARK